MRLVLASASPRRRELLAAAGIDVDVDAMDVDETLHDGERPDQYVERVARLKAIAGNARYPDRIVLAADTTVTLDAVVLGKPVDEDDAARMLRRLSGRTHEVLTAVAIAWRGRVVSSVERTRVTVHALSDDDVAWYVASGEPLDKAGGYAIQGLASRFIPRIDGSYSNVVGLPVAAVLQLLGALGLASGARVTPPVDGNGVEA